LTALLLQWAARVFGYLAGVCARGQPAAARGRCALPRSSLSREAVVMSPFSSRIELRVGLFAERRTGLGKTSATTSPVRARQPSRRVLDPDRVSWRACCAVIPRRAIGSAATTATRASRRPRAARLEPISAPVGNGKRRHANASQPETQRSTAAGLETSRVARRRLLDRDPVGGSSRAQPRTEPRRVSVDPGFAWPEVR
jgi:hypothetical protein